MELDQFLFTGEKNSLKMLLKCFKENNKHKQLKITQKFVQWLALEEFKKKKNLTKDN